MSFSPFSKEQTLVAFILGQGQVITAPLVGLPSLQLPEALGLRVRDM